MDIFSVVAHQRFPASLGVQPPAHVGETVGHRIIPGREIGPEKVSIEVVTLNTGQVIVFNLQRNRLLQIALEREVHVTGRHHDPPVDRALPGEAQAETAGPVGDSRPCAGEAGGSAGGCIGHIDRQVRAGSGADDHGSGLAEQADAEVDDLCQAGVGLQAFQYFRMLIADHHQPCAL